MPDPEHPPHFCHSTFSVSLPGAGAGGFHQDHHHFRKSNSWPINLAERERNGLYVQLLYYPYGFKENDGSVVLIPGSHKRDPLRIDALADDLVGSGVNPSPFSFERLEEFESTTLFSGLSPFTCELPAGSMVFLNARCYHAYTRFAAASGQVDPWSVAACPPNCC